MDNLSEEDGTQRSETNIPSINSYVANMIQKNENDSFHSIKDASSIKSEKFNPESISSSFDMNNKDENKTKVDIPIEFNNNQEQIELEEELKKVVIYNPCELDFQIAAQLIQDAIHGTAIYFKQNKTSLMYKLITITEEITI